MYQLDIFWLHLVYSPQNNLDPHFVRLFSWTMSLNWCFLIHCDFAHLNRLILLILHFPTIKLHNELISSVSSFSLILLYLSSLSQRQKVQSSVKKRTIHVKISSAETIIHRSWPTLSPCYHFFVSTPPPLFSLSPCVPVHPIYSLLQSY